MIFLHMVSFYYHLYYHLLNDITLSFKLSVLTPKYLNLVK